VCAVGLRWRKRKGVQKRSAAKSVALDAGPVHPNNNPETLRKDSSCVVCGGIPIFLRHCGLALHRNYCSRDKFVLL